MIHNTQKYILISCVSFLVGLTLFLYLIDPILSLLSLTVISIICLLFARAYRKLFQTLLIIICFISIWWFYGLYYQETLNARIILVESYEDLFITYTWEVYKIQKRDDYYDEYIMKLHMIWNEKIDNPNTLKHILRVPKNYNLFPWEIYEYSWILRIPQDFNNFSYRRFLESRSIFFRNSTQSVRKLEESPEWLLYKVFLLREHLIVRSDVLFPYRESLLLSWVLFWAREHLPNELRLQFNNSWLTHFITTSWFHVSLVILFLTGVTFFLPIYIRIWVVVLWVLSFAVFVWYGAPVVRASIMWILWYFLLQSWHSVRNFLLIILTLTLMVIVSPLSLLYDVSLQLSFLAVLGILFTQDYFKKIFSFLPNFLSLRDACVLTFSAFVWLFPVLFFQFWQVSLLTPIANMLVAWTIPIIMLWGAFLLFIDYFSQSLAFFLSYPIWILLRFDIWVVELIGSQDWSLIRSSLWVYNSYAQILYLMCLFYSMSYLYIKKLRSA